MTTCPRKGLLLRCELNSTATSDGSAQKKSWETLFGMIFDLSQCQPSKPCYKTRFVFRNSGISRLALIFNLSNSRATILHAKNSSRLSDTTTHICFSLLLRLLRQKAQIHIQSRSIDLHFCVSPDYIPSWSDWPTQGQEEASFLIFFSVLQL